MNNLKIKINSSSLSEKNIISNFNYEFNSDKVYVLLGRNGAGKTTLFRISAGLEKSFNGLIELNDKGVLKASKDIQIVFQDNRLLPWKTVFKNLKFINPEITKTLALNYLTNLGLEDKLNSYPNQLSGGEQSRLSLLLTFLFPPKVLLLDEPFHGLDIYSLRIAIDEIKKLRVKHPSTVLIFVTHNLFTAQELGDEILILNDVGLSINKVINRGDNLTVENLEVLYNKYHAT